MYIVLPFILGGWLVDVSAGVTQEEGYTGFLHLPFAVLALIFIARRIQPFLSLVDREVEILCTNELIVLHLMGIFFFFFVRKDRATALRLELTPQRQNVSRLPTKPPGRPTGTLCRCLLPVPYTSESIVYCILRSCYLLVIPLGYKSINLASSRAPF